MAAAPPPSAASPGDRGFGPKCSRLPQTEIQLAGCLAPYLTGVTEQWLKVAPWSNPAMLEMFKDRDRLPRREMVPWAGEFAGKYLTAATQVYRIRRDPELKAFLERFCEPAGGAPGRRWLSGPLAKGEPAHRSRAECGGERRRHLGRLGPLPRHDRALIVA